MSVSWTPGLQHQCHCPSIVSSGSSRESRLDERRFCCPKGWSFFFSVISLFLMESKIFSRKSPADFPSVSCSEQYQMFFPWRRKEYYLNWQDKQVMAKAPSLIIFLKNMPECLRKATIHVCYRRHWLLNQGKMMSLKIYPLYTQNIIFTLSLQYPFLYGHCKNETVYSANLEYHLQIHCF